MSINREATALRNESPDRELYGFRDSTLFAPLDLILYEVDSSGISREITPPASTVEFKGKKIKSGAGHVADITSYDVPPLITKPFVKANKAAGAVFAVSYDLNSYSTPTTVLAGTPICLFGGQSGKVVSTGLVPRLYGGTTSSINVFEVDLGVLPSSELFHGSQVFIGSSISLVGGGTVTNQLLGMLITTSKGAGSFSLVFPANNII
jgi:hypothetical protein